MRRLRRWAILVIAGLAFGLPFVAQNASSGQAKETAVRVALSRALPVMKGDGLKVTVLEVVYAPGAASSRHNHPCPVVGYVVAGAVRMQVKGEPEAVYKSGDTFFEAANGVRLISANASSTEPAKFVAYFLCDHETELSVAPIDRTGGSLRRIPTAL